MGKTIQLWYQRCDVVNVILYSQVLDAAEIGDASLLVNVLAVGTGSVALSAEQSLDPSNPNSWSPVGGTATGSVLGNATAVVGGTLAGTTVAIGPYIRLKAAVTVSVDAITWSAAVVLRG